MLENKYLIINADDFGFSTKINEGIIKCFTNGILTSTTMAVNMPFAKEAANLALKHPELGVGIHLNVVRGHPVLESNLVNSLIDNDNKFYLTHFDFFKFSLTKPQKILSQIENEYRAQIKKFINFGLSPTHLDSERHHAVWPAIFKIQIKLAHEFNIPAIRTFNEPYWKNAPKRSIKKQVNSSVLRMISSYNNKKLPRDIAHPNFFYGGSHIGKINVDYLERLADAIPTGISELMTHPGLAEQTKDSISKSYLDNGRETEYEALCNNKIKRLLIKNNIELVNYEQFAIKTAGRSTFEF